MIDFDYAAPETWRSRISSLQMRAEPHKVGGVVYVPESASESRWFELFGTPERAARTLFEMCRESNGGSCAGCPILGSDVDDCSDTDALLEWLRGEGEADEA